MHLLPQRFDSPDGAHRSPTPRLSGSANFYTTARQANPRVLPAPTENLLSGVCGLVGRASTGTYGLVSLYGNGYAPDVLTDAIARCIAINQYPDGRFFSGLDMRPPLSAESAIPDTAMSARVVKLYAAPALPRDAEAKIANARSYLLGARPWSGDDYAYRLLGLLWTGTNDDQIQAAVRDLVTQQRPDGGWAQTPYMSSDAYETGLSLWALATADSSAIK